MAKKKPTTAAPPALRLEWRSPAELTENPKNWRRHPTHQIAALSDVIREVGWAGSCLFNERTGRLIDGHARRKIALAQGCEKVPVLIGLWDEAQERMILATLDPIGALAEADTAQLTALLGEVSTGSEALAKLLEELAVNNGIVPPEPQGQVEVPAPPVDRAAELEKKWGTATGQLWLIPSKSTPGATHRLLCGDSTVPEDVAQAVGPEKAALFATDPPYLVDYTGADRPDDSGKDWSDHYREIDIHDASGFFTAVFRNALTVLDDAAAWYVWHSHKRVGLILEIWEALGILNHQQIIWVKPCAGHNYSVWPWRHEPCLMGWKQGHRPPHDGDHSHQFTSVWDCDWDGACRPIGNAHTTEKPLELFRRPMRKHTQPGDVCFEPFSGSGSQLAAAEQTGRVCCALEIEPAFVAVALERLAGMGLEPRLAHARR
jgi:DNA modification methylase